MFKRQLNKLAVFLFFVTILFIFIPKASAQESAIGINLHAQPAYEGNIKFGEWLPVWVELENSGADVEAEVQIRIPGSGGTMVFTSPVALPNVSHKRFPVYVLPNNFTRELDIRLVSKTQGTEQLLASTKVKVQPQPTITYMVGMVVPTRGALYSIDGVKLPGITRPKVLVDMTLSELPDRYEGLRSFDCLIINDIDTSNITSEIKAALETWVRQGGRLIIGGGAGAQRTAAGLPQALLIIKPQGSVDLDSISELSMFAAGQEQSKATQYDIRVSGPFVVSTGESTGDDTSHVRILASHQDIPLVVEKSLGNGYVDFVALDLTTSPFDAWNGTIAFWEELLSPGAAYPEWLPTDISTRQQLASQMPYALSNLPMLDLPSTQGLALLLGIYIILVGPINYLVLRWRKHLHWAWVSIPAITILFAIGSFGLGYAMRGTDLFINKVAVIELQDSGEAYVTSYLGLFSPARSAYEIQVKGDGLISPLTPYYNPWEFSGVQPALGANPEIALVQGNPGFVRGLSVDQWSMQSFMVEGLRLDFGRLTADLRLEDDALVGTLRNESNYPLSDVVIIMNKKFQRLGYLPAGEEAVVNLDLPDLSAPEYGPPISYQLFEQQLNQPGPNGPQRQAQVKQTILDGLFSRMSSTIVSVGASKESGGVIQAPIVLGWLNEAPPSVQVTNSQPAQQTTAVVAMPLSYQLTTSDLAGGRIVLPVGLIPGRISQFPTDGGTCGDPGGTAIYLNHGDVIFEFTLLTEWGNLQVENLKLGLWMDGNWINPPGVAFYDWQVENWVSLEGVSQGVNLVPNAASLVNSSRLIQLRLSSPEGSQGNCYYIAMGLEGYR